MHARKMAHWPDMRRVEATAQQPITSSQTRDCKAQLLDDIPYSYCTQPPRGWLADLADWLADLAEWTLFYFVLVPLLHIVSILCPTCVTVKGKRREKVPKGRGAYAGGVPNGAAPVTSPSCRSNKVYCNSMSQLLYTGGTRWDITM
ncbi:predicted protein [Plenodomus lingam JN3]|uniref:Predicted protein n=1 Tax=Leptosphaeria maculans (strain JN3 / isolate v23.1.3 / race Av1-4-5-6-7-8) TaxID=985895 RepID=E5A8Y4_LEPMJ|nr:predicted protein [Plenodomus lingam JN3]CBY00079.1 predicted protein [Plenodomus lingam JN3]